MGELQRRSQVVFQPKGEKPMPGPFPQVFWSDKASLRVSVEAAAKRYWRAARRVHVEVRDRWQQCRGEVVVVMSGGSQVTARFFPVHDPARSEWEQAEVEAEPVEVLQRAPVWVRKGGAW